MLVSSARRRAGRRRHAHHLLAAGSAIIALTAVAGLGVSLSLAAPTGRDTARLLALGMVAGAVTLLAGMLMLPGAADTGATALQHLLDGLAIAGAIWFLGWVLVTAPTRVLGEITPVSCWLLLLPLGVAVLAFGLTTMVSVRMPRPRGGSVGVGAGITAASLAGAAVSGGVCQGWAGVVLSGALALPAGLTVIAVAARATDREPEPSEVDTTRRGAGFVFLPMVLLTGAAGYQVIRTGAVGTAGALAGCLVLVALVGRQYLALRDVRRGAQRLREREAHFRGLAHTDPLTGLANRRGMLRVLHQEAFSGVPCVLLGIDMDGFKSVNDLRGHDVGDQVLLEVGGRLRMNLRPGDAVARLGGDEFAVLMWATEDEAERAAHRLLDALAAPYEQGGGVVFLSASIGLAAAESADGGVETLMRNADLALRYAKVNGKSRVERYEPEYDSLLRRRTTLEHELRGAIERDELRLVFQPVVALPSVRPVGAEALLRWTHPQLGAVGPDEFIPAAEESGLIAALGRWVLDRACRQLARWLDEGYDVWVAVNVSPRELRSPDYVGQVAEVLRTHGVPPQRLVLEVTEHAVATDPDELRRRLRELRDTGVRIALDDFGAGYSSLGQLRELPVDILKIDRKLVAASEPLVDVVVRLGHRLGLEVLAEGISTPAHRAVVEESGCRFGQGFLFGGGVPAEHVEAQLRAAASPRRVPASASTGRLAISAGQLAPAVIPAQDGEGASG
ncbi:putative bifunctional diguanylate cyclase/phosphodiesterase [Catenuloplanes japonicus]|uniref:putative bifunctional diguanylate cyclase/phosphodiesterase n=1 Tax=Catenuloplanes japonicus TaxID=33876 RepID=UPI00068F820C